MIDSLLKFQKVRVCVSVCIYVCVLEMSHFFWKKKIESRPKKKKEKNLWLNFVLLALIKSKAINIYLEKVAKDFSIAKEIIYHYVYWNINVRKKTMK